MDNLQQHQQQQQETYLSGSRHDDGGSFSPTTATSPEIESEKFVKINPCNQMGIMQPLEHLHTVNLALGIRLEQFFEQIFRSWGVFVARNPWSIIIGSIVISLYLAAGVFTHYQVTTDPVDLWVPAGSQARSDMELFNEKFWKFYRIEQVIIEPKLMKPFTLANYTNYDGDALIEFGPAFEQQFMLQAFDLYENIKQLKARYFDKRIGQNRTIHLEDICYKPLSVSCAVQSIFTYFGQDIDQVRRPNYIRRIQNCVE